MDDQATPPGGPAISAAQERGRPTLDAIQYLRGIAALMIVLFHVFPQLERMGYSVARPLALSAGVDIFFVISGFVMVYSTARHPGRGGLAFLRDRLVRIAPLYWALTLVMLLMLVVAPGVAQTSKLDPAHAIASFLFVPWLHPVQKLYYPLLVPGWSLNYEMFFYVVFALALAIARRRRTAVVAITCGVLAVLTLLPLAVALPGALAFYTRSLILEFGFGMLLAESFLRRPARTSHWWWLAIAGGAAGIALSHYATPYLTQALAIGLPALLIVLGTVYVPLRLDGWGERTARQVGDASYSIYLAHYMAMSALGQLWRKVAPGGPAGWIGFALFAVAACAIGGILVYKLVELPLTRLVRNRLHGGNTLRKAPLTAATPA